MGHPPPYPEPETLWAMPTNLLQVCVGAALWFRAVISDRGRVQGVQWLAGPVLRRPYRQQMAGIQHSEVAGGGKDYES
jgi:hypothetical protein